jgi:hydroxymethylpyrimidine pyrophosphatase-like HAD family hydrolase
VRFEPTIAQDFEPALDIAAKIISVSADFEFLARCERDVRGALAGEASVARSQPYYLDITHPLSNKGAALSERARLLAVPLAEFAVIGDDGNDIAMFERSASVIAMGNATPQVRQAAEEPGPDEAPVTISIEPHPREIVAQILSAFVMVKDARNPCVDYELSFFAVRGVHRPGISHSQDWKD